MKDRYKRSLWKQAFILALLFHFSLFAGFVWGPSLFRSSHKEPVPYTVKLMAPSALKSEKAPEASSQPKKPQKPPEKKVEEKKIKKEPPPKKEVVKKKVKVEEKVVPKKPPVKKNAVSLKPKKPPKKVVKKKEKRKKKPTKVVKKGQKSNEKDIEKRIREISKRLKEKREEEYLKKRLEELAKKRKSSGAGSGGGRGKGHGPGNKQAQIYGNFVKEKIWRNWHFPKALANRSDLTAEVAITITKDGRILDMQIKKYSGFAAFDRSVIRAIKESAPLPPLPPSLGQGPEEIIVNFDLSKANLD